MSLVKLTAIANAVFQMKVCVKYCVANGAKSNDVCIGNNNHVEDMLTNSSHLMFSQVPTKGHTDSNSGLFQ